MALLKGNITSVQVVQFMVFGVIGIFILSQLINFSAIASGEGEVLKNIDASKLAKDTFKMLIVGMGIITVWMLTGGLQGRLDRKRLVTIVIFAVLLYVLYDQVLSKLMPDVFDLDKSAAALEAMVNP